MNLKRIFIMSIISFISGLFGCEQKENVSFSEFQSGNRDSVTVSFEVDEIELGDQLLVSTQTKSKSKTTTVFTSVVYFETNKDVNGLGLVLGFRQIINLPLSLKSSFQKKPYIKKYEGQLIQKLKKIESVERFIFEPVVDIKSKALENNIVLETKI